MPDIGDLLNTAAHNPRSPLDLATVERRAGVLRRRQQALLAAPVLVLALVVSALVLTRGPGAPDELGETDGGTVTAQPGPLRPTVTPGSPAVLPGTDGMPAGDVIDGGTQGFGSPASAAESGAARPGPSSPGGRPVAQPPAPTPTSYPSAPSCRVVSLGMKAGQTRTCSFTATEDGGYRVRAAHPGNDVAGDHWVDVTRDGKTTRYGEIELNDSGCGNDVIEPGDLVTVSIYRSQGNVFEFEMAAGEGYGCNSSES